MLEMMNELNSDQLVTSRVEHGIAEIILQRPSYLNALNYETLESLRDAIGWAVSRGDVRVVVLRGEGRSFCSGGDVRAMDANRGDPPTTIERMIDSFHASILALNRAKVPIIASVHGAVAGGGVSLALACDLVVAARGTRLFMAYAKLGTSSDGGLSFWLTQRLGRGRALELLTSEGALTAPQAHALGLVHRVVEDERVDTAAMTWARELAALPPQPVSEFKQLTAVQVRDALQAHLDREKAAFVRCARTDAFARRVAAFASGKNSGAESGEKE